MYHADNDFGYEPTSDDIAAYITSPIEEADICNQIGEEIHRLLDSDPFISLTKEGEFGAPVYVFTRASGERVEMDAKEYAKLVNSQR